MPTRHSVPEPPAIILGGSVTAVPVARSLARGGVRVLGVGGARDPLRWSRYCASYTAVSGPGEWIGWLRSGPGEGVLMPVSDACLELVAEHRAELTALGYTPFEADDRVVTAMLDKERTYELAARSGVGAPATRAVRRPEDIERAVREFSAYPCGIKPILAHLAQAAGMQEKVIVVADQGELEERLRGLLDIGIESLVTEIVVGGDDAIRGYFTYMDDQSNPLVEFTNRKLRQYPAHFGVGCYVISEWDPEVAEEGLRFLRGAGLRGVAHVELKRDSRDGGLRLIECNHRFNLSIELLRAAGVDLPLFTYRRLTGGDLPSLEVRREGLALWHPVMDLRAMRTYRRDGDWTRMQWLRSLARPQRFSTFAWDDPLPGVIHNSRTVWSLVRVRLARGARRLSPGASGPPRRASS